MQGETPSVMWEWGKILVPGLALIFTAGWIGTLIQKIAERRKTRAAVNKTAAETEAIDIQNAQKRLEKYVTTKDVMAQLLDSTQNLSGQVNNLTQDLQTVRGELARAVADIEARNAVIKYQQDENRWLIEREAKFYETIAASEAHNKECQQQLARQNARITELERLSEQRTEASLRTVTDDKESSFSG